MPTALPLNATPIDPASPAKNPASSTLATQEAELVLGTPPSSNGLVMPLAPSAVNMFGPRGLCLVQEQGPLWVADTGHHRLLGWRQRPSQDYQPADWVIGQPDFTSEGQNAKAPPTAASVSVPTGICSDGQRLIVADAWNHRVLIWHTLPQDSHVPADQVLGQADFTSGQPNRGQSEPTASTLHWPYGVMVQGGRLYVADTGNRRVLVWRTLPTENGQPADFALGQQNLTSRDENGGASPSAASLRWPHALACWQGNLALADAGNNRVLLWPGLPDAMNEPAIALLGQRNFAEVELNRGTYFPCDRSLSMPYGIAATETTLWVADTANSRCLTWSLPSQLTHLINTPSQTLIGQTHFRHKIENRARLLPTRDSLCWPYGLQICGKTILIADSGNNRVLLWSLHRM